MAVELRTEQVQIGEWLAEPALDRLSRNGETVKLEPRTMRLLMRLCESPGRVLSPQQLLDEVWAGVVVGPASVYQAISQLRRLLADTDPVPTYIATIPRKGYRLIAPVRRVAMSDDRDDAVAALPSPVRPDPGGPPETPAQIAPRSMSGSPETSETLQTIAPRSARRQRSWLIAVSAVAAIAVVGAGVLLLRNVLTGSEPPSVVVLPFTDMTADQANGAFCDGLTEELSTTLSQLPALRVVARTSAFAFRGKNIDVREIGRRLSATHVLEGSVRRSGDAIRVTAQLIDARRGYQSWSESYDLRARDVLRLQSDIARSVAAELEVRFSTANADRIAARGAGDGAAYELYLLGRHYFRQRTPEANARAVALNAQAIEQDPNFALGYVGLAEARLNEFALSGRPVHEIADEVEPLLNTALRLNPDLSEAYSARGALRRELNRFAEAKKDLTHAIALDRNNVQAIVNLGRVFEYQGQARRALESFTRARLLDPLDFMRHVDRCVALQDMGRYAEAAADCAEARALQPQSEWGYAATSWLAAAQGQLAQALYWNGEALRVAPGSTELYLHRTDYLLDLGLVEEAKATLERARTAGGDVLALRIRYADVLMIERGGAAVKSYLQGLKTDLDDGAAALDLLTAVQVSLTAGDDERARHLAARALASPDFPTIEAAHRTSVKWGVSYQLPLALVDLHAGDRQAARARIAGLLETLDELERNGYSTWGIDELRADALGLLGDATGAMRALQRATQSGWRSARAAQRDPYLAALFPRPDFRALMRTVEQLNAAERARYQAPQAPAKLASM